MKKLKDQVEKMKQIWGKTLFIFFCEHIDENGWLTKDWVDVLENEIPSYTLDEGRLQHQKNIYHEMVSLEFEYSECGNLIRPKQEQ